MKGHIVHLWGHCPSGGAISSLELAELLDCSSFTEHPVVGWQSHRVPGRLLTWPSP